MFLDVFIRGVIPWYLAITIAGWLAFPLVYRLLPFLPDRGLSLLKPAGLLVWAYAFWILASFQILQNNLGGVVFALILLAAISAWAVKKTGWRELVDWLRTNLRLIVTSELLFILALSFWSVMRAADPAASGTEKPMELAFINAILNADSLPPHDPWLSGYAISYYYFGYVMVAMLARVAGIGGAIAFNLGVAGWFALTAVAAFGVLYNLLALRRKTHTPEKPAAGDLVGGALAPFFVLLVSNLEGFLEVLHAGGVFWQRTISGALESPFWTWLDIQELTNPPAEPFRWEPFRPGGIWWWRASRVLQDFDINNQPREIIDEFPFFSYLLGDLHPHVLAMPFVLLAVALALHLYLWVRAEGGQRAQFSWLRRADLWLAVITLGSLSFLNTWDFPIYLALFAAAYLLARYQCGGWRWSYLTEFLALGAVVGVLGILTYLPFYLGFASQARGLLPSLVFFTRGVHFWVMFGSLLLPIFAWLIYQWRGTRAVAWQPGVILAAAVIGGLWLASTLAGWVIATVGEAAAIYGDQGALTLVLEALVRRLAQPGAWLTLLALLALVWSLIAHHRTGQVTAPEVTMPERPASDGFILLVVLVGTGLTLFPEFFYLYDQFGWRMNTIFKFYFQAWILWALAAAYGSVVLIRHLRGAAGVVFPVVLGAVVAMALVYPAFGISRRLEGSDPAQWTLDGADHLARFEPEELDAIQWLQKAPEGVVVESVGGSYTGYARVATFSGKPTVLGWPGHEVQWRGGAEEMGSRETDIEQLYRTNRWEVAAGILQRYQIRYVYVGSLERSKYRVNETLFERNLARVYQSGQVSIYEVPQSIRSGEQVSQP